MRFDLCLRAPQILGRDCLTKGGCKVRFLTAQLQEMKNQSLNLFQRRDEMDELEGFQQQELSKVKHMVRISVLEAKPSVDD